MFQVVIFVPNPGPTCEDECWFTNLNTTVTGGILVSCEASPPQLSPGGGLVIFDCQFQQTPGATEATVNIESPCVALSSSFEYPESIRVSIEVSSQQPAEVRLCWNTVSNTVYQVQSTADFGGDAWESVGDPVTGNGMTTCVLDAATAPSRFYRVITVP